MLIRPDRGQASSRQLTSMKTLERRVAIPVLPPRTSAGDSPAGFVEMLEVTSQLRKAQEEDADLASKSAQQKTALQHAEARAEDARRRLGMLRQGAASATTAMAVLGQLQRDVSRPRGAW